MTYTTTQHDVYGTVQVESDGLADSNHMVKAKVKLRNPTKGSVVTETVVGKVALNNKGGYTKPKRHDRERIEQHIQLAMAKAGELYQQPVNYGPDGERRYDWDELFAEASLALCLADGVYDPKRTVMSFGSYAKQYIGWHMAKHMKPSRQHSIEDHYPHLTDSVDDNNDFESDWEFDDGESLRVTALKQAMGALTENQRTIMTMLWLEHKTQKVVADLLGIRQEAVSKANQRGMATVKKLLMNNPEF